MKTYKILLLLITLTISLSAQVSVKLQQPPPYQFKVEQFWKIILINNSNAPISVRLTGTATEPLEGKIIEATSSVITLQPGVRTITGRDLGPFTVSQSDNRYKNILMNTGSIPSGSYDICVEVFDANEGRQIASDCIQISVENFNRMELVTPMNGEILGFIPQDEIEIDEKENVLSEDFISRVTKKKKDNDWDEVFGDLKKKKDKDWDEAVGDLKKKKDKDWDEAVGDLKKRKDKDWDEAVGDLKKKKDKDWDEVVGDLKKKKDYYWNEAVDDLKKKKDYDWDEAVGDLKKKKDKDWDEAVGDLKKKKDHDWDEAVGDFKRKIVVNNDRHAEGVKRVVDSYFDLTVDDFNIRKSLYKDRSVSNTSYESKNIPIIIFSWLPPVPVPPGARISYRLDLVEIMGYQSVHSAMASNPMYYQSPITSSTVLRYPIAAKQMIPGKKYAWKIVCFIDGYKIQESEIRSFSILGSVENKEQYSDNSYNSVSNQYSEIFSNDYSSIPSGLSLFSNKLYGPSASEFSGANAPIDLFSSPSNFKFFGDAKLTHISSSKPAQFSQLPLSYQTLEFNPRLSVYDIPFGMNVFLSSLNNVNRQSVNSISFILDLDRLKSKIKERLSEKAKEIATSVDTTLGKLTDIESLTDPNKLVENAEKHGLISPSEKLFLNIKTLGIGRTYPEYSELTVSSVPVNGINVEINPGILYLAVAAGNNTKGIDEISFKRSFLSARIGLGQKEYTHFFLTALKMNDDPNSIQVSSSNSSLTPQENVVLGAEGKVNLFNNTTELYGEGAVSGFTRNSNDADIISESIPNFVKKILTPKLSTVLDYAWKGKLAVDLAKSATYVSIGMKRIGAGFMSLASPNLRQDQFQFDFNFDQKFVNKKITLKTYYKVYNDNLIKWKQSTTTTASYGINLGFNFPKLPFVQLNYSPYTQRNDNLIRANIMNNTFDIFSFMTGYSYQLASVYATTMFSFMGQSQNAKIGIVSSKSSNESYMINQSLSFEFPLTLSSTFNISQSKIMSISSNITDFDINGNYQISEMISANLGGAISKEENYTKKNMIYFGSSIILTEWLRFEVQGNITNYKDLSGGGLNYNDSMLQASVMMKW
jgi:hypothetical protein